MRMDRDLFSFAAQVLERNGGLVEENSDHLMALLPESLSQRLELPEELRIGEGGTPLLYGSPLLDRLIDLATREIPVVYCQLAAPYLKKEGFEQTLAQSISFGKVGSRIVNRVETQSTYMVLVCHYVALSDERKEGLVQVAVHEKTGAVISGMPECWSNFQAEFLAPGNIVPCFSMALDDTISIAMKCARRITHSELAGFLNSMRRHLNRDVRNTQEYYKALKKEMEGSLEHSNISEDQRNERIAKIQELPDEMDRRIDDLRQKYNVQVTLTACAALRFLVPVVQLSVEIRYRKLIREIELLYNPITRCLDPLVCQRCHGTTYSLTPGERGSDICLYCIPCGKKH